MIGPEQERSRDRWKSALGVVLSHLLLGYAFLTGLNLHVARPVTEALKVFDIPQDLPPPVRTEPAPVRTKALEGAASPRNIRSVASPVAAPVPRIELPVPPPVAAAPIPRTGPDPSAGAAPVEGPGTGSGGIGTGTGSGGSGDGAGGAAATRARLLEGTLSRADYPRSAQRNGVGGAVAVRITVGTDGRVSDCAIVESSGNADLDETSCRLIRRRYRFAPARDASGRPVPDMLRERHVWWTRRQRAMPPPASAGATGDDWREPRLR